jgi:hypothetical protein
LWPCELSILVDPVQDPIKQTSNLNSFPSIASTFSISRFVIMRLHSLAAVDPEFVVAQFVLRSGVRIALEIQQAAESVLITTRILPTGMADCATTASVYSTCETKKGKGEAWDRLLRKSQLALIVFRTSPFFDLGYAQTTATVH